MYVQESQPGVCLEQPRFLQLSLQLAGETTKQPEYDSTEEETLSQKSLCIVAQFVILPSIQSLITQDSYSREQLYLSLDISILFFFFPLVAFLRKKINAEIIRTFKIPSAPRLPHSEFSCQRPAAVPPWCLMLLASLLFCAFAASFYSIKKMKYTKMKKQLLKSRQVQLWITFKLLF